MKELFRLLGYAKRYSPLLALSVFLMMIAGAMNGALPLLLKPVIDQVYPLAEIRAAHERIENKEHFGKVIVRP